MTKLSQRLQAIADMVPKGSTMADIGTDHGMLPCYLVEQGIAVKAFACDVNEQPLQLARRNVDEKGLTDFVDTRLGNGLQAIAPGEADVVVLAGMGAALMIDILDASPKVTDKLKRLIVQPNIGAESIRIWAEKNRWEIVREDLVRENDRFSMIIAMEPCFRPRPMTSVEMYLGPILLKEQHPLLGLYISEEWEKAQMVLQSLQQSDSEESRRKEKQLRQKWDDINGVMKCKLGASIL